MQLFPLHPGTLVIIFFSGLDNPKHFNVLLVDELVEINRLLESQVHF